VSPSAVPPIGGRLREERSRRGVSVRGLARDIGVSASLISQIETNKSSPSVSTLYAITTALGISIEDLFGGGPADGRDAEADAGPARGDASVDGAVPAAVARAGAATLGAETIVAGGAGADGGGGPDGAAGGAEAGGPGSGHRSVGPNRQRRVGPVVEPNMREILTLDSGVTWELLGQIPNTHVDFLLITYQPGGTSSSSASPPATRSPSTRPCRTRTATTASNRPSACGSSSNASTDAVRDRHNFAETVPSAGDEDDGFVEIAKTDPLHNAVARCESPAYTRATGLSWKNVKSSMRRMSRPSRATQ
jgi:transcriptional regulator with XRE-family HTH domain